jgi:hypothetical protein
MLKSSELSIKGEFFSKSKKSLRNKAMDDEYVPYDYF